MSEGAMPDDVLYEHRWLLPPVQFAMTAACWGPLVWLFIVERGAPFRYWTNLTLGLIVIGLLPVAFWFYAVRWVNHAVRIDRRGVWIDGQLEIPARRITAVIRGYDDHHLFTEVVGDRSALRPTSNSYLAAHPVHGIVHVPRLNDHNRVSWLRGAIVFTDRHDAMVELQSAEPVYVGWFLSSYRPARLLAALVEIAPRVEHIDG